MRSRPAADLVKALYRSQISDSNGNPIHPLADMLVGMLGEGAIKKMIPVLDEVTGRDAWDDLILLATLPPLNERDAIASDLQVLTAPVPGAGTRALR